MVSQTKNYPKFAIKAERENIIKNAKKGDIKIIIIESYLFHFKDQNNVQDTDSHRFSHVFSIYLLNLRQSA